MKNNATVEEFRRCQKNASVLLNEINVLVEKGKKLGIDIPQKFSTKLENVMNLVGDNSPLKIALIGGFSEGKTSIAAGWMEDYDKSSMKISQQESSDEVNVYKVDNDIEIVDTPGMFGLKEKYNDQLGIIEKYKDITKKYVSEAHLILYVMDPANPIKESHKEDLVWLFRTLGLLPRTVFVLSRFDEVSDVEDDWDYRETLKIKKENVISRLKQMIQLTKEEEKNIQIVAVAANPYGNGTDYWLNNLGEYKKLSKLDTLQDATKKLVTNSGGYFSLVYEMQKSVIYDILGTLNTVENMSGQLKRTIDDYLETTKSLNTQIKSVAGNIGIVQTNLGQYFIDFFSDLIRQARGCGLTTLQGFVEAEIGKDGCILYANIQNEITRQTRNVDMQLDKITIEFSANSNQLDSMVNTISKDGIEFINKSNIVNPKNILWARDGLVGIGKTLGFDIAKFLKFKPWGATNLAKGVSNTLAGIGLILDGLSYFQEKEAQEKCQKAINDVVSCFEKLQQEMLTLIKANDFQEKFFPEYIALKEAFNAKEAELEAYQETQNAIKKWCDDVKMLSDRSKKLN